MSFGCAHVLMLLGQGAWGPCNGAVQVGRSEHMAELLTTTHNHSMQTGTVEALIWHPSDSAVKPIVANRRIERLPEPRYDPKALSFTPMSLQVRISIVHLPAHCVVLWE